MSSLSDVCSALKVNPSVSEVCWGLVGLLTESLLDASSAVDWYGLIFGLWASLKNGLRPLNLFLIV